jgi:hypothetical protein
MVFYTWGLSAHFQFLASKSSESRGLREARISYQGIVLATPFVRIGRPFGGWAGAEPRPRTRRIFDSDS